MPRAFTNGIAAGACAPGQRQQTILVAEDDEVLLSGIVRLLNDAGYQCLSARNGQEALDVYRGYKRFDMLIADVFMPVLDGISAWHRMRRSDPALRCILMSGDFDGDLAMHFGPDAFLRKPFESVDLLLAVRDALAGKPA